MKFREHLRENKNQKSLKDKLGGSRATGVDIGPITGAKKKKAQELAVRLMTLERGNRGSSLAQLTKNRKLIPGVLKELSALGAEVLNRGGDLNVIFDGDKNITREILAQMRR